MGVSCVRIQSHSIGWLGGQVTWMDGWCSNTWPCSFLSCRAVPARRRRCSADDDTAPPSGSCSHERQPHHWLGLPCDRHCTGCAMLSAAATIAWWCPVFFFSVSMACHRLIPGGFRNRHAKKFELAAVPIAGRHLIVASHSMRFKEAADAQVREQDLPTSHISAALSSSKKGARKKNKVVNNWPHQSLPTNRPGSLPDQAHRRTAASNGRQKRAKGDEKPRSDCERSTQEASCARRRKRKKKNLP